MPVGDGKIKLSLSRSPVHQPVNSTIPVASISPRRTPNRFQNSRTVSGVGVGPGMNHLDQRDQLYASPQRHHSDQLGAYHLRQRRTSAKESSIYAQVTLGPNSKERGSIYGQNDSRFLMSGYGNINTAGVSVSSTSSMRCANSLDSLDAVSNSIQQARANSFINSAGTVNHAAFSSGVQENYHSGNVLPRQDITADSHDSGYMPVAGTRSFQRTFPFRKSTNSSSSKTSSISSSVQPSSLKAECEASPNVRQSSDVLNDFYQNGMVPASFWLSPCRVPLRRSIASPGNSVENEDLTRVASPDIVATVSPFRAARNPRVFKSSVNDNETERLKRELLIEQEHVQRLSAQLSTNSHVVSAFEHSLANMTDRLTKLTNSSDKKDQELLELKQVIHHLKESSEKKGFSAPVRWRSDENVLSGSSCIAVAKTKNNGTESDNEEYKRDSRLWRPKKQTWLRSSLSKAFSRNKSNVGESLRSETKEILKNSEQESEFGASLCKQRSVSVSALDDPFVADLQRQLAAKDILLTETRLEALTSASQLQGLRETVIKLKSELRHMQRENDDLKQKLHISNGNKSGTDTIEIDDEKVSSTLFANMSLDKDSRDSTMLDVPVIVRVKARETEFSTRIGYIRMCRRLDWSDTLKWRELDLNVQCVFGLYMARLDPFDRLGMSAEGSILRYEYLGRCRKPVGPNSNDEVENEPQESSELSTLKSRVVHITLRSRNKTERRYPFPALDEVVFTTLRPRIILQGFCDSLQQLGFGLLLGPKGSGKRFTCQRISELMVKENVPISENDIFRIPFNKIESNDQRLRLLEEFEKEFHLPSGQSRVCVAVFEDVDSADINIFQRLFLPRIRRYSELVATDLKVLVLMTATNWCPALQDIQMAKISLLQIDQRVEKSFLGFFLRRKVIEIETETKEANDSMIVAVNWLNRLAIHFEEFCQRIDPDCHFSPAVFTNPPLDNTHKFRSWFLDLWNTKIVLTLRDVIKMAQSRSRNYDDIEDPVRYIFRTWPWRDDVAGLPQALRPVLSNSAQKKIRSREEDNVFNNDDPLLDMLLCLQQATEDSPSQSTEA